MKVLYIAPYTSDRFRELHREGGAVALAGQRKVELVCEALADRGHEVTVLSSAILSASRLAWRPAHREFVQCGRHLIPVHYPDALRLRPFGGLLNALRAPWLTDRLAREHSPDAVILYNTHVFECLATVGAVARAAVPVVVQVEDLPLARRREWGNLKPWLDQRCWNRLLVTAAAFTAVNATVLDALPPGKPATLFPGAIDERLVRAAQRRTPPFASGSRTLGYFGALTEQKGADVIVEVACALPEPWKMIVTGGGPLASRVQALQVARPDRVQFHGTVAPADLYRLMCSCDCTLVPPERITGDGTGVFPFKVFEYIAAGTHVIAPPLRALNDLDLKFVQRWDGSARTLPSVLAVAEADYHAGAAMRAAAAEAIREHFSVRGIGAMLDRVLADAFAARRRSAGPPHHRSGETP